MLSVYHLVYLTSTLRQKMLHSRNNGFEIEENAKETHALIVPCLSNSYGRSACFS